VDNNIDGKIILKSEMYTVNEWGRRGTLIDYWWESQRERDH
jgi:hypothetical protein